MNPYENAYSKKRGFPFAVLATFLIIVSLGLAGVSIYLYIQKDGLKLVVDAKVNDAVSAAKVEQLAKDQKDFDDYVAQTTRTFVSSSDFGSVTFEYPKEWSVYNDINGNGKDTTTYTAYFSPGMVAPVTEKSIFLHALELKIAKNTFDTIKNNYKNQISDGLVKIEDYKLTNDYIKVNNPDGILGQKVTGYILYKNEVASGTMVQFVTRDKVLQLYLMQPEYTDVFNNLILKTIRWTK